MASLQFLNGRRYSHSSLEITLYKKLVNVSEIFIDISDLDYDDSLEFGDMKGTSRGIIGVTAGDYTASDTTFTMGKSTFQNGIVDAIGTGWMGSELGITVSYNDDGEPLTVDVLRCLIKGAKDSSKAGPEGLMTVVTLKTLWISRNGIFPIPNLIR